MAGVVYLVVKSLKLFQSWTFSIHTKEVYISAENLTFQENRWNTTKSYFTSATTLTKRQDNVKTLTEMDL